MNYSNTSKIIKKILNKVNLDCYRLTPSSNSAFQLALTLKKFSVDLVLDVGANEGQFALELRDFGFSGRIVSFEPLSTAHSTLSSVAKRDPLWEVYPRCAIGDKIDEVSMNISRNSVSSSILPMTDLHSSAAPESVFLTEEKVNLITLDSISENYLNQAINPFLKIDTQGFEWQVLDGAPKLLPKLTGLVCELSLVPLYEGQRLWQDVFERLEKSGFMLWAIQKGFTDFRDGRTLQINAIFVNSSLFPD